MKYTVYDRLLKREVGQQRKKYANVRGIYGDRQWVADLDIVDELEGHNGCVNALSWSTSGRLLASGSDDHRINIHSYHPESSTSQFSLTTSILTNHRSNIFSVKFMPYSGDRIMVSATDNVRVFDIEHSGHSALGSAGKAKADRNRNGTAVNNFLLTEGDTNAKAFRCHTDTVKRIVTEDNPYWFLTCSNDGDVRQWDVRQPAKAYPPSDDSLVPPWARDREASDDVPKPLISYRRHGLDLNSVSCSASQPHYVALGGAHLHCFLHDRRMLGRDKGEERGSRLTSPTAGSEHDNQLLAQSTQCVKKFAPNGKQNMKRNDSGHITACKISDAHPNELIVSWSQDHIYSFNILRAPDVSEAIAETKMSNTSSRNRIKDQSRKRKRSKSGQSWKKSAEKNSAKLRSENVSDDDDLALRVTYGNGQSEDIPIQQPAETSISKEELNEIRSTDHYRIARTAVKLKQTMFDLGEAGDTGMHLAFTSVLGSAHSILSDMDDIARTWGYPMNPDPVDVAVQNKLRDDRAASRRFVQTVGTLARVLGGQLLTGANSDAHIAQNFATIQPAPMEREMPQNEQFAYDFLKAIVLWLDSGPNAVIEGFSSRSSSIRLPIPMDSDMDAIDEILIPYLLELASDDVIVDVDVSKFEKDKSRILYRSEKAAVIAFSHTLKIPFADLTGAMVIASGSAADRNAAQDRAAAKSRWALQIGRGVLYNAARHISFSRVDRAFGGRGIYGNKIRAEEQALKEKHEEANQPPDEGLVIDAKMVKPTSPSADRERVDSNTHGNVLDSDESQPFLRNLAAQETSRISTLPDTTADGDVVMGGSEEGEEEDDDDEDEDDEDEDDEDEDDEDEDDEDEDDEEDNEEENGDDEQDEDEEDESLRRTRSGRMFWRSGYGRNQFRKDKVEVDVLCAPHTRVYTGHCNVKTVKDVNYFGLQDEYVVSGSDSGHVFIWDRKTTQLVNILEGDGEVVNVVQGHPYEPTMAVSGIDHTIKIFSPDTLLQRNARKGIGVQRANSNSFSSLSFEGRAHGWRRSSPEDEDEPKEEAVDNSDSDSDGEVAANGLSSRKRIHQAYEITSKNDMDRKGGRDDYFISQAVFAQLARHIAAQQNENGEIDGGARIVISEENCAPM